MIVRACAPLRLGLAGGGTDVAPYCDLHGGYVMNAAIDKYAYAMVDESPNRDAVFHALDADVCARMACGDVQHTNPGLQLLIGAYLRVTMDFLENRQPAIRIRTYSDAPPGPGLAPHRSWWLRL